MFFNTTPKWFENGTFNVLQIMPAWLCVLCLWDVVLNAALNVAGDNQDPYQK